VNAVPHHLVRRVSATEVKLFSELHRFLEPGSLLHGGGDDFYESVWVMAQAESFDAIRSEQTVVDCPHHRDGGRLSARIVARGQK
jgi:hypothetical protein